MTISTKLKNTMQDLPDNPGIYLFYSKSGELIYVGKATSLKNRVRSYFIGKRTSRPIEALVHEVTKIKHKETESALEAAILESVYIKKYQPKYNVLGKDNKSWNYIVITKEDYPQVKTIRQHTLAQYTEKEQQERFLYIFGPYPGLNSKATLKILRKLFLYSTCQNKRKKKQEENRPCLYYQMGECLGVCTEEITPKEYRARVITPLAKFLRGNKKHVIKEFEKRMKRASKQHQYEEAARLRDQIHNLQKIYDISMINDSFVQDAFAGPDDAGVVRIEGYDISNLGSGSSVGSMVVFEHGKPKKSEYRKFRVKTVSGQSDVGSLEEVMRRRLARSFNPNTEKKFWKKPDILLIDGGKPQVNRVKKILDELQIQLPLVGIAKGPDRKKNEFIFPEDAPRAFIRWVADHQRLLVQVRDEAHRFAVSYQRQTRQLKKRDSRR